MDSEVQMSDEERIKEEKIQQLKVGRRRSGAATPLRQPSRATLH